MDPNKSHQVSWQLFEEANKNNSNKYSVYRCSDSDTGTPTCPCDPNLDNPTGRGISACPYGITSQNSASLNLPSSQLMFQQPNKNQVIGTLFSEKESIVFSSPPQFQPRQLVRIGNEWRSAN